MNGHWQQQQERGSPTALRIIRWVALYLGRAPARFLLYPITAYFLILAPTARRHSRAYLTRVLGRTARPWDIARHIHSFSAVILDRVFLLAGRESKLTVTIHGEDILDTVISKGQGGLLIGSHLGSYEVLRTLAVTRKELKIKALMYRGHSALVMRLLDEINPRIAETVIDLDRPGALLHVHDAIREGALVGIMGDRIAGHDRPLYFNFLGKAAAFPSGPMRLAAVLEVPVLVFFGIYAGGNRYHIYFERLTDGEPAPRTERDAWIRSATHKYVQRLETHARRAPYNWFNFYDFWSSRAEAVDDGDLDMPVIDRGSDR